MRKEDYEIEPDISVILPIYNVMEYLRESLDSLLRQGDKLKLQVIMVDDGSTDDSGKIADAYAEEYANFQCIHIQNGGPSNARNCGVKYAKGKYIAFLDPDDVLVDGIYEKMYSLAEQNQSELTICNACRFDSLGDCRSGLFSKCFHNAKGVTHIFENHQLIYDTLVWNKLIKRSFYEKYNFEFPPILYEDIPVATAMHVLCNKVSMCRCIGYKWRMRDGASRSITQRTQSMRNLKDRITSMKMLDEFFEKNVSNPDLIRMKQFKAVDHDLMIFINNGEIFEDMEDYKEQLKRINDYIQSAVDPEILKDLSIIDQQKYEYAKTYNVAKLKELIDYHNNQYYLQPVTETNEGLMVELPEDLFTIPNRNLLPEYEKIDPFSVIKEISLEENILEIYACTYYRRMNLYKPEDQKVQVFLYNPATNDKLPLEMEFFDNSLLGDPEGSTYGYDYYGSGYKATLDLKQLKGDRFDYADFYFLIQYENRYFKGNLLLNNYRRKRVEHYAGKRSLVNHRLYELGFGAFKTLKLSYKKNAYIVEDWTYYRNRVKFQLNRDVKEFFAIQEKTGDRIDFEKMEDKVYFAYTKDFQMGGPYTVYVKGKRDKKPQYIYQPTLLHRFRSAADHAAVISSERFVGAQIRKFTFLSGLMEVVDQDGILTFLCETRGDSSQVIYATDASLVAVTGDKEIFLDQSECNYENGQLSYVFNIDYKNIDLVSKFGDEIWAMKVRYTLEDGVFEDALCSFKKMLSYYYSEDIRLGFFRTLDTEVLLWVENKEEERNEQEDPLENPMADNSLGRDRQRRDSNIYE